jgi:hypothetical protein
VLTQIDEYERDRSEALADLARARDTIDIQQRPGRADDMLLHLNVTFEILHLEADLRWAAQAREMVSSLLDREVLWPSARARTEAVREREQTRRIARGELFAGISDPAASIGGRNDPTS